MEEKYPLIEPDGRGWRVRTGRGGYLPGVYLNHLLAKKALVRYLGQQAEANRNKAEKAAKSKKEK